MQADKSRCIRLAKSAYAPQSIVNYRNCQGTERMPYMYRICILADYADRRVRREKQRSSKFKVVTNTNTS